MHPASHYHYLSTALPIKNERTFCGGWFHFCSLTMFPSPKPLGYKLTVVWRLDTVYAVSDLSGRPSNRVVLATWPIRDNLACWQARAPLLPACQRAESRGCGCGASPSETSNAKKLIVRLSRSLAAASVLMARFFLLPTPPPPLGVAGSTPMFRVCRAPPDAWSVAMLAHAS